MTVGHAFPDERRLWAFAAAGALVLHGGAVAAVLALNTGGGTVMADPVMVVELPPPGPAEEATSPTAVQTPVELNATPQYQTQPDFVPPEAPVPEVSAPLPPDPVTLPRPAKIARPVAQSAPQPAPQPRMAEAAVPPPAATVAPAVSGAGKAPGSDPRAKKKAADYYSLLMAHLQRNKRYPSEAKKARQQGIVTVRFSIDRSGTVTASSIKKSSGHALLDQATLDLMQRVSPLPPIPREMGRESLTIALPIDYALRSK